MTSVISIAYTGMCWILVLGLAYKMLRSKDVYEQLVCGVGMVPFLLRALQIR
jgi:ABC-type spermidine/putrescine transport system permease subunit I